MTRIGIIRADRSTPITLTGEAAQLRVTQLSRCQAHRNPALVYEANARLKKLLKTETCGPAVALGMVSILGFSSIIHFLTGHNGRSVTQREYGSEPYGG